MDMFPEEVCREIGNYVYRLIDPRNDETFYVGTGTGNRVFSHAVAAASLLGDSQTKSKGPILPEGEEIESDDEVSLKFARIRSIQEAGLKVVHVIHRHKIPEEAMFEVEAALIDAYPGLVNVQGGHGSFRRGPMHAQEIISMYGLRETTKDPQHKLLLLNINRSQSENHYESVRCVWHLDVGRARRVDYVLAVRRGVVLNAFEADEWMQATIDNFPSLDENMPTRWGFTGKAAQGDVQRHYQNTRLPAAMTHVRSPVRYWE